MALTESSRVFSWGIILMDKSCGRNHCLLLTSGENIYWFGFNWIEKQKNPKKITDK
jgi:alpha-tubulin suppressor-like RCC1 family protein